MDVRPDGVFPALSRNDQPMKTIVQHVPTVRVLHHANCWPLRTGRCTKAVKFRLMVATMRILLSGIAGRCWQAVNREVFYRPRIAIQAHNFGHSPHLRQRQARMPQLCLPDVPALIQECLPMRLGLIMVVRAGTYPAVPTPIGNTIPLARRGPALHLEMPTPDDVAGYPVLKRSHCVPSLSGPRLSAAGFP